MDVLTHFLLPYGAALAVFGFHHAGRGDAGHRVERETALAYALVVGVAGAAPDLDSLYSWAKTGPSLWWLQHRGASHSIVGASINAMIAVGLLHLLHMLSPRRLRRLRYRKGFLPVAAVAAWTHLLLDGVTYEGVPLFWPLSDERYALQLFHFLIPWLVVPSGLFLVAVLWRRLDPAWSLRYAAAVLVVLLVVGGVRLTTRPDVEDPGMVFPRSSMFDWTVLEVLPNGTWEARLEGRDRDDATRWYADNISDAAGVAEAIGRAKESDAYRGFRSGSLGPQVIWAAPSPAGVDITFTDVAQRFEVEMGARWTPADPQGTWGVLIVEVHEDDVRVRQLGW